MKSGQKSIVWQRFARTLVAHAGALFLLLILASLVMAGFACQVRLDEGGVSFGDKTLGAVGQDFPSRFNADDYILMAIVPGLSIQDPALKVRLEMLRSRLLGLAGVKETMDLARLLESAEGNILPGNKADDLVATWKDILPGMRQLVSLDGKVLGIVIGIDNEVLNGFALERTLGQARQIVLNLFPEAGRCYAAGIPVVRAAFERYNLQSAMVFGALGLVFGIVVAWTVFRTFWAAVMVLLSALVALVWTLGSMGLLGIGLNMASGMSFGFVLIASCTTIFHILSAYRHQLDRPHSQAGAGPGQTTDCRIALEKAYAHVLKSCFMCAVTTAVGFFSLTFSPVPMVAQAGQVICMGVMVAFFLALPVTAFILPRLPLKSRGSEPNANPRDILGQGAKVLRNTTRKFSLLILILALGFGGVMGFGIPKINSGRHLSFSMLEGTRVAQDLSFIRKHLSTGVSFSLVIQPENTGAAPSRKFWYDLLALENKIKALEGVAGLDSMTPFVFWSALKFSPGSIQPEKVYQALAGSELMPRMAGTFWDVPTRSIRVVVHIHDNSSDQIEALLDRVKRLADTVLAPGTRVELAGQLIYLRSQTGHLVTAQTRTLFSVLLVITLMMIWQLGSVRLGLLSLIPNALPLLTVFGVMGWFNIPLDPLTVFAAVISFGLSVDDSIHFLSALAHRLGYRVSHADSGFGATHLETALDGAFTDTAKALIATTAVLFFSAMGLVFSSFSHVSSLGILVASAAVSALLGDLLVLPSLLRVMRNRLWIKPNENPF